MKIFKLIAFLTLIIILPNACSSTKKAYVKDANLSYFGETVRPDGYVSMNEMFTVLEKEGEFVGKVTGTVSSVCQKKGCWMTLEANNDNQELFIKFKDYGFFMPFDLAGNDVVIRGTAKKEVTSVDMLRHYAMDGGATKEEADKITEPETSFRFLADGVVVLKK